MKKMPSKNIRRTKNKEQHKTKKRNKNQNKAENNIINVLSTLPINKISKETGFCQRKSKKIRAKSFLLSFFLMIKKPKITFSKWAVEVTKVTNKLVSKQAMQKRMTEEAVDFVREVLKAAIVGHMQKSDSNKMQGLFEAFNNVYLHDSTHIRLPDRYSEYFPCHNNKDSKPIADVKIETIYNCANGSFSLFELRSYHQNDQSLTETILDILRPKDLYIRDLGFFKLETLKKTMDMGAYFLTRKPHGLNVYDVNTQEEISLVEVLKKKGFIDKWVLAGNEKVPVRLVAIRLPDKVAQERIRKAGTHKRKSKYSKEYHELLKYEIFLTNVPQEIWTAEQVGKAYGLRWRIEIIFKSWKSCFNIEELLQQNYNSKTNIECLIYLTLLYITLFQVRFYEHYRLIVLDKWGKHISLLKLTDLIIRDIEAIIFGNITEKRLLLIIRKHAVYDSRKDRVNTMEIYYSMAA